MSLEPRIDSSTPPREEWVAKQVTSEMGLGRGVESWEVSEAPRSFCRDFEMQRHLSSDGGSKGLGVGWSVVRNGSRSAWFGS